jgi:cephalosporin hydroxylase
MQSDWGRRLVERRQVERVQRGVRRRYEQEIRRRFARIYYDNADSTWRDTQWLATPTWKLPSDLWIYQELIVRMRPDYIVETGTAYGGSALYLATVCDAIDHGQIITVDTQKFDGRPEHRRIEYVFGSSTDPAFVEDVRQRTYGHSLTVILDSDHRKAHVLHELLSYGPLVPPGHYLVVEDTNVNGHPVFDEHGAGPWEAVTEFLAFNDDFVLDGACEKFLHTASPRGFLRRRISGE